MARYSTAAKNIAGCLIALRIRHPSSPTASIFDVVTVEMDPTMASPLDDGEPAAFDECLNKTLSLNFHQLDSGKGDGTKDTWDSESRKRTMFLHTELQLSCFYALHPDLCPLGCYIGVSKRCCFLCDFVIKALQKADAPYTPDNVGHPLLLAFRGTHGGIMLNWVKYNELNLKSKCFHPFCNFKLRH
ncbi:hypothetical protein B0H10DRAFT_1074385 [Mycena sp. CBHHK59/15]|nr:hypothetical protein B0H10DRAFT_1074385 [Mycena sp. CBHHK59/15]